MSAHANQCFAKETTHGTMANDVVQMMSHVCRSHGKRLQRGTPAGKSAHWLAIVAPSGILRIAGRVVKNTV